MVCSLFLVSGAAKLWKSTSGQIKDGERAQNLNFDIYCKNTRLHK